MVFQFNNLPSCHRAMSLVCELLTNIKKNSFYDTKLIVNKKSPANTKGNVQQQCMFELWQPSKTKSSRESARWPATNYL